MAKECVLYDKLCTDCKECEMCDLDSNKICDNCGSCIEDVKPFRSINVDEYIKEHKVVKVYKKKK
jgi:hypothetical protein